MKFISHSPNRRASSAYARRWVAVTLISMASLVTMAVADGTSFASSPPNGAPIPVKTATLPSSSLPIGVPDSAQPSGVAPPGSHSMPNYSLTYTYNFNGRGIPSGWNVFTGVPGGDPGGRFAASHVVVRRGLLLIQTWKDPHFGNRWVTGGLCHCGHPQIYGAFFVRSKVSGPGPNQVELLWPSNNSWPPEIDFNETGGTIDSTTASLHWGAQNHVARATLKIDMTKWHTWGVVWTRKAVLYVVDGRVWSSELNPATVPHRKMRLDFEQRAMCDLHRQCPRVPVTMSIDWVVEYAHS